MQLQFRSALRARILRQQEEARLHLLRRYAITMPGGQLDPRQMLRSDACEVEHDGAEAARLQQEVRAAQRTLDGVVLRRPVQTP